MKINLNNIELFNAASHMIGDEECFLVIPQHIGCKWNKQNMIFRSSVWNSEGELISAGFKKFFNWGEQPDLVRHPDNMKKVSMPEKMDGSCLIVSKYKGHLIIRTRGTVDARNMQNGFEIDELVEKYPKAFSFEDETAGFSRLFEWTTPNNRIVIDYGDSPDIYFIGKINHADYSYAKQDVLDAEAVRMGVRRPRMYSFGDIPDMIRAVHDFKGKEGIVVYFDNDQECRKLKGVEYLTKHSFKSNCSFDAVLDMFIAEKYPSYSEFEKSIVETFDFECFEMSRGFVSRICDAYRESVKILDHMKTFVDNIRDIPTRKEQALKIIGAYGKTNRSSFAFILLDNKPVTDDMIKKLIYQITK